VLLALVAVFTIPVIFSLASEPAGAMQITVTGHQWWWDVEYPTMKVHTANEIHIPVGRPVYITLKSNDVIHSFWIPRLAGKQDLEPGRVNHLSLQAVVPGAYEGQCAEYCGASHANMRMKVIAQTAGDFDQWVQSESRPVSRPPPPDVLAIMDRVGCSGCHTIQGVKSATGAPYAGVVGPNLTHLGARTSFAGATEPNRPPQLAAWLRDPQAVKPGNDMTIGPGNTPGRSVLSDDEIRALVAYLEGLK
jgi:cytochrome c oxidase subunit 2